MNKYTTEEIKAIAAVKDAVGFDRFCEDNNIDVTWLDVTLTNYNDEYYNVDLPKYGLNVCYYDGELDEINEL
jgi:hypothetical protein